ncbi:MAG: serine/threonine protein kinase [Alphaproteobacteria bacterium]
MSEEMRNALPLGLELDGYRLERVLGAGGFGITYLAVELFSGRKVAIKEYLPSGLAVRGSDSRTVHPNSSADKSEFDWGLDRFRQEARILTTFKHANIVPVLRAFEANGTAYMVMEYQEGTSLGAILKTGVTLDEAEVVEILGPLMDGLEAVHNSGFLHRDIKPDNIYIRTDGAPMLLDFGAARQAMGNRSKSLTAIVSAGYAPHEQYETDGNQGPWTDIYSLGAVLYRAVTGRRPPESSARMSAQFRGNDDPMVPASVIARGRYSDHLLAAIDRSTAMLERDRPQSIRELRALLGDMSKTATGATTRLAAAAKQTQSVAAKPGLSSRPLSATSARAATGDPAPVAKKRSPTLVLGGIVAVLALGAVAYTLTTGGKPTPVTNPANGDNPTMIAQSETKKQQDQLAGRAKADDEAKAKADAAAAAAAKARADAEAKMHAELGQARRAEQEARLRTELEASKRAEAEARAAAEEARRRAEAEARAKAEAEARLQVEAAARAKVEADAKADAERKRAEEARKLETARPALPPARQPMQAPAQSPDQHAANPSLGPSGDLSRLFVGKTNYWGPTRDGRSLRVTFLAGGRVEVINAAAQGQRVRGVIGTWRVQGNNQLCLTWPGGGPNSDGAEFCARIIKVGDEYTVFGAYAGFRDKFRF